MNWISSLSYRNLRIIHISLVTVLSCIIIWWPGSGTNMAVEMVVQVFHQPFALVKKSVTDLTGVADVNRQLRDSLATARMELSFCRESCRETVRLRQLLGFEPPAGYKPLPVRVVSVHGHSPPTRVIIDKGIVDSVRVNWPVINQDGIVGRISRVYPTTSEVQLLTDPKNRVAARVAQTEAREMGIVRYLPLRGLVLDNFPSLGRVQAGDTVISSGLGGVYPSGLMVGTVSEVRRPENSPACEVDVALAANLHSIEELFVLFPDES